MKSHTPAQRVIASSLLVSMLGLSTFGTQALAQQAPAYPSPAAPAASAYTPPTADQLYQMVAPIALFPDQLVALVLAGSTYPDQITAANDMVTQNPNLTGAALVSASDQQPWDPSVKALTGFPAVLSQMSSNIDWTTALGQAYYNDPSDVMNAVQVMRQRAQAAGHLSSNRQMVVTTAPPVATPQYVPSPDAPLIYDGPAVIPPPPETIVIEPAQPDVVYVPAYNPAVVYGAPVAYYPGYAYAPPVYAPGVGVTIGLLSFGVGIAVGAALFSHVGWGWHNWGMHWAPPPSFGPRGPNGGWRPSVVYNHTTYISRTSTTVINRYNTNRVVNNYGNNRPSPQQMRAQQTNERQLHSQQMHMQQRPVASPAMRPGAAPAMHPGAAAPAARPGGAMTMPHFNSNDMRPGARPAPQAAPGRPMEMNRAGAPASNNAAPRFEQNRPSQAPAYAPRQATQPAVQQHENMPRQNYQQPRVNTPRPAETRPQMSQPQFHPQQQPQYHPQSQPQYHQQPQPQYHPQPQPRPQPQYHPQPQPQPHPQPQPRPAAAPAPHPAPAPAQRPAPKREEERK